MAVAKRHNSTTRPRRANIVAIVRVATLKVEPMFHRSLRLTPESTARAVRPPRC